MYKLVFTQEFEQKNEKAFMELEQKFVKFEKENPNAPKGKRYVPYIASKPVNTLIWECEFPTIEAAFNAKKMLENDETHTDLFAEQVRYFVRSFVEIYKSID